MTHRIQDTFTRQYLPTIGSYQWACTEVRKLNSQPGCWGRFQVYRVSVSFANDGQ